MKVIRKYQLISIVAISVFYTGCKTLTPVPNMELKPMPNSFAKSTDTLNSAKIKWKEFFVDKNLVALIDTALANNLDLLKALQDIEIARNNVRFRKGLMLPSVEAGAGAGIEKVGLYTSQGAGDASTDILPGKPVPENLPDFFIGLRANWEVDIWGKLKNSKKAAFAKYLSSVEGKNFVITNLVSEVANLYYELLALDNQLEIIRETIKLQKDAYEIVKVQKEAAMVTELALKQFEAQVLKSQAMEFDVLQKITENENKINFLLARYPQPIVRDKSSFTVPFPNQIKTGIPSQLLSNRPDIKQAELELTATKCDVKSARAEFYPSFNITGVFGYQAFNTSYLFTTPASLVYNIIGELMAPLINRSAIKAQFNTAKAVQIEAMYDYQKTILNSYVEVANELSNINNLEQLYTIKTKQVEVLTKSIEISNDLFRSARADYLEVLFAQRDALDAKLELVETKKRQCNAITNIYNELGGGWN